MELNFIFMLLLSRVVLPVILIYKIRNEINVGNIATCTCTQYIEILKGCPRGQGRVHILPVRL